MACDSKVAMDNGHGMLETEKSAMDHALLEDDYLAKDSAGHGLLEIATRDGMHMRFKRSERERGATSEGRDQRPGAPAEGLGRDERGRV